jgi:hypothetical protein
MQRPGKKGKAHKPPQAGKQAAASFGANKPKPKPKSSGPKSSEGSLFWRVITIIAVLLAIAVGYWFYAKVSRASAGEHSKTPFGTQAHRDLLKVGLFFTCSFGFKSVFFGGYWERESYAPT